MKDPNVIVGSWDALSLMEERKLSNGLKVITLPLFDRSMLYVMFVMRGGLFFDSSDGRGMNLIVGRIITNHGYRLAIERGWEFSVQSFMSGWEFTFVIPSEEAYLGETWNCLRKLFHIPSRELERLFLKEQDWLLREWQEEKEEIIFKQDISEAMFAGSIFEHYPWNCLFHGDDLRRMDAKEAADFLEQRYVPGNLTVIVAGPRADGFLDILEGAFDSCDSPEQARISLFTGPVYPRRLHKHINHNGVAVAREWFFGLSEEWDDPYRKTAVVSFLVSYLQSKFGKCDVNLFEAFLLCDSLCAIHIVVSAKDRRDAIRRESLLWRTLEVMARDSLALEWFQEFFPRSICREMRDTGVLLAKVASNILTPGRVISLKERIESVATLSPHDLKKMTRQLVPERCIRIAYR